MAIDQKKYKQVILYLCQKLGGEIKGKKKLAKLLYYADFDFYEKMNQSITGEIYKALPMGPFPKNLEKVTKGMTKEHLLEIKAIDEHQGYLPTETYRCLADSDNKNLSPEEIKILDRVIIKYGHLNGKQLEDLTHVEAPYLGTELKKQIPYELSYYRGTDFTDL